MKRTRMIWSVVGAFPVVAWVVFALYIYQISFPIGPNNVGLVGDAFGSINALFSGLAFVGLLYAIYLQRQDLDLQREDLKATREELAGQKEQLQVQNETLKLQAFENTFFQLLRLQSEIVSNIDLNVASGQVKSARDCFRVFYRSLRESYSSSDLAAAQDNRIRSAYAKLYGRYESDLGHYFRSLYNIVKLVHNSPIENKRLYTNILRAQLSKYELLLLFYNCLSSYGDEKFKPLVEEYALLKSVSDEDLLSPTFDKGLFKPSAF